MKVLWIGGNHPRHLFILNKIHATHPVTGVIIQKRETLINPVPAGLSTADEENFVRHFKNRALAEQLYFEDQQIPDIETLVCDSSEICSEKSCSFVKKLKPDVVFIFGSVLIKDPLFSILPKTTVNLHLGLSPRYRGAATLFWPFYFMEPNFAGSTFHLIVSEPDAGQIIHQVVPQLNQSDGIHDVACKTIRDSGDHAVKLLDLYKRVGKWDLFSQRGTGKNFLTSDFRPEHLRINYNLFSDRMVSAYLDGKLKCREPKLIRQFI